MAEMPIPDDWDGETTCRWAVCWPDSPRWFAILNGLIGNPFQGRFWDANTGSVVGVKESFRAIYNKNFSLEGVIMACGDTGLSELADAVRLLAQNQCCQGVPGGGGVSITVLSPEGAVTPIYGGVPPGGLPGGDVPPGYPGTLEEYDGDKCRTAAALITGWVASMRNLAYVNWLENTALVVVVIAAIAGIIVLPEFLIPVLIAAAIGQVGLQSGLLAMADGIEENFDDWVCYLYESESTEQILGLLSDALDAVLAAIPATGALGWALKTMALILMNSDTVNRLFELNQGSGPPYDCSGCAANLRHQTVHNQNYTDWTVFEFGDSLDSYSVSNYVGSTTGYLVVVSLDDLYNLELTLAGATPFDAPEPNFRAGSSINGDNGGQADVYNQTGYELSPLGVGNLTIASSTAFTATITLA